ncbi:MAG: hypothetical protein M3Y74_15945 [Chloroflexota bacterium]|nr:hypothetical protein [Chloroflexota bacterium]
MMTHGHEPGETRVDRRIAHALAVVERVLVYVVALFLVGFAALALVNTVAQVNLYVVMEKNYNAGIAAGIDSLYLCTFRDSYAARRS